jgi:predicted transcriptional regulator
MTKNGRYFGYIRIKKKPEIGKIIGFSRSTVSKFLKRFDTWENIENKP